MITDDQSIPSDFAKDGGYVHVGAVQKWRGEGAKREIAVGGLLLMHSWRILLHRGGFRGTGAGVGGMYVRNTLEMETPTGGTRCCTVLKTYVTGRGIPPLS